MKITWTTQQRKINDLIPYDKNPRGLTETEHADLSKSLDKFDLAEIPAINTNNTIIAGHQRLHILQQLGRGDEVIDVRLPNRELTDDEVAEYCIRSNGNTGHFDYDALANYFDRKDLVAWGFDEGDLLDFNLGGGSDSDQPQAPLICPECGHEAPLKDFK